MQWSSEVSNLQHGRTAAYLWHELSGLIWWYTHGLLGRAVFQTDRVGRNFKKFKKKGKKSPLLHKNWPISGLDTPTNTEQSGWKRYVQLEFDFPTSCSFWQSLAGSPSAPLACSLQGGDSMFFSCTRGCRFHVRLQDTQIDKHVCLQQLAAFFLERKTKKRLYINMQSGMGVCGAQHNAVFSPVWVLLLGSCWQGLSREPAHCHGCPYSQCGHPALNVTVLSSAQPPRCPAFNVAAWLVTVDALLAAPCAKWLLLGAHLDMVLSHGDWQLSLKWLVERKQVFYCRGHMARAVCELLWVPVPIAKPWSQPEEPAWLWVSASAHEDPTMKYFWSTDYSSTD